MHQSFWRPAFMRRSFSVSFFDGLGISTSYKCDNPFNYRWTDVVLKKSYTKFFDESFKQ